MDHRRRSLRLLAPILLAASASAGGCHHPIPVLAHFQGTAQVAAQADVRGEVAVKLPAAADPGPMVASVVQASRSANPAPRVAVIDVDGLLLNQNADGLLGTGENPVAVFREKLTAASADGQVAAVVIRIHSPGGGVTACDIMADELDRFKAGTRKPVVACLLDVATSGAYYLAIGADRVVAQPTAITGGIGAIFNHVNLQDAMAQLNVVADPVKAGSRIDMGSVTGPISPETRALLEEMAGEFHQRFLERVSRRRPGMSASDRQAVRDGRIVAAPGRSGCIWSIAWARSTTHSGRRRGSRACPTPTSSSTTEPGPRSDLFMRSAPPRRGWARRSPSVTRGSIAPSSRHSFTCGSRIPPSRGRPSIEPRA